MKRLSIALVVVAIVVAATISLRSATAHDDHHHHSGDGSDATPVANTGTGAVYLQVTNRGDIPDRLLMAATDAAQAVEMHISEVTDGVMRMTLLPGGFEIPADGSITLAPQESHLMLVNLNHDLRAGDTFSITLLFQEAGVVEVDVVVAAEAPTDGTTTEIGDLVIANVWAIPAPMIDGETGTPEATPEPAHHH